MGVQFEEASAASSRSGKRSKTLMTDPSLVGSDATLNSERRQQAYAGKKVKKLRVRLFGMLVIPFLSLAVLSALLLPSAIRSEVASRGAKGAAAVSEHIAHLVSLYVIEARASSSVLLLYDGHLMLTTGSATRASVKKEDALRDMLQWRSVTDHHIEMLLDALDNADAVWDDRSTSTAAGRVFDDTVSAVGALRYTVDSWIGTDLVAAYANSVSNSSDAPPIETDDGGMGAAVIPVPVNEGDEGFFGRSSIDVEENLAARLRSAMVSALGGNNNGARRLSSRPRHVSSATAHATSLLSKRRVLVTESAGLWWGWEWLRGFGQPHRRAGEGYDALIDSMLGEEMGAPAAASLVGHLAHSFRNTSRSPHKRRAKTSALSDKGVDRAIVGETVDGYFALVDELLLLLGAMIRLADSEAVAFDFVSSLFTAALTRTAAAMTMTGSLALTRAGFYSYDEVERFLRTGGRFDSAMDGLMRISKNEEKAVAVVKGRAIFEFRAFISEMRAILLREGSALVNASIRATHVTSSSGAAGGDGGALNASGTRTRTASSPGVPPQAPTSPSSPTPVTAPVASGMGSSANSPTATPISTAIPAAGQAGAVRRRRGQVAAPPVDVSQDTSPSDAPVTPPTFDFENADLSSFRAQAYGMNSTFVFDATHAAELNDLGDAVMSELEGLMVRQFLRARTSISSNYRSSVIMLAVQSVAVVVALVVTSFLGFLFSQQIATPFLRQQEMKRALKQKVVAMVEHEESLSRFVSSGMLQLLRKRNFGDVLLGDHVLISLTIMFSDVWNFTTMSERFSPMETFQLVNSFYSSTADHYRAAGGMIDKFLGDGVISLFIEVSAAINVANALHDVAEQVSREYRVDRRCGFAFQVGVGIHSGDVVLGTVGSAERMDVTIISDAANTASRVESYTRQYDAPTLISEASRQRLSADDHMTRHVGNVYPKGKQVCVMLYEPISADTDVAEAKREHIGLWDEAIEHAVAGRVSDSLVVLEQYLSLCPSDTVAIKKHSLLVEKLEKLQNHLSCSVDGVLSDGIQSPGASQDEVAVAARTAGLTGANSSPLSDTAVNSLNSMSERRRQGRFAAALAAAQAGSADEAPASHDVDFDERNGGKNRSRGGTVLVGSNGAASRAWKMVTDLTLGGATTPASPISHSPTARITPNLPSAGQAEAEPPAAVLVTETDVIRARSMSDVVAGEVQSNQSVRALSSPSFEGQRASSHPAGTPPARSSTPPPAGSGFAHAAPPLESDMKRHLRGSTGGVRADQNSGSSLTGDALTTTHSFRPDSHPGTSSSAVQGTVHDAGMGSGVVTQSVGVSSSNTLGFKSHEQLLVGDTISGPVAMKGVVFGVGGSEYAAKGAIGASLSAQHLSLLPSGSGSGFAGVLTAGRSASELQGGRNSHETAVALHPKTAAGSSPMAVADVSYDAPIVDGGTQTSARGRAASIEADVRSERASVTCAAEKVCSDTSIKSPDGGNTSTAHGSFHRLKELRSEEGNVHDIESLTDAKPLTRDAKVRVWNGSQLPLGSGSHVSSSATPHTRSPMLPERLQGTHQQSHFSGHPQQRSRAESLESRAELSARSHHFERFGVHSSQAEEAGSGPHYGHGAQDRDGVSPQSSAHSSAVFSVSRVQAAVSGAASSKSMAPPLERSDSARSGSMRRLAGSSREARVADVVHASSGRQ